MRGLLKFLESANVVLAIINIIAATMTTGPERLERLGFAIFAVAAAIYIGMPTRGSDD
jgi:hypothetical protein